MRCALIISGLTLVLLVPGVAPDRGTVAAEPEEGLVQQVGRAIDRGVKYLRSQQREIDGSWEITTALATSNPGGQTSLALLALLNAGVPVNDPAVQRGLKYLRKITSDRTYVVALQTMVFAQAGEGLDRGRIARNVRWLLDNRRPDGWSYGSAEERRLSSIGDNSNTQYALLGLHAGLESGLKIDEETLQAIRQFYLDRQKRLGTGGWNYRPDTNVSMTMTTAGLCGLLITGMDLDVGQQKLRPDGSAEDCGVYKENEPVARALDWIGRNFPSEIKEEDAVDLFGSPFYCLYGIERAGRLSGQRFFGGHDWYEIGCRFLVDAQKAEGSWGGTAERGQLDHWPIVATSFSLLFLSKGRTPVLITKLAYGPRGSQGWNNKHSDLRHLTEFCSRELFNKRPLAWQTFDVRDMDSNREINSRLAEELAQSPVVFFNGHDRGPDGREEEILKDYLENGGFVFVEACCNDPDFRKDFEQRLVRQLFPDSKLELLPATHPVWQARFPVAPNRRFPLYGVQQGCKTVLIYSPRALAGYWEANLYDRGDGQTAFQLGANVMAYATGLEPPRPRLTEADVVREDPPQKVRRGYLKVAQLKYADDWHPAPKAMLHLMSEARRAGLDVALQTAEVGPWSEKVLDYRFLYMHGRKSFNVDPRDLGPLRFDLKTGGTLLADACCGSKRFDESFRKFMEALWAEENKKRREGDKLRLVPIPPDDELFSKEVNGTAIRTVRCRRPRPEDGGVDPEFQTVTPALEGVKYNGRWVVIYSRYDIGCALEKHQSPDCLGHDYDSAVRLGKAAVLYALKR